MMWSPYISACIREGRHRRLVRASQGSVARWWCSPCVGEGATCHPLNGDGLDFYALGRSDNREVSLESVSGKLEAICFGGLWLLESGGNVDLDSHFADVNLECDEAAEDGRDLRLSKVIDGIRRREPHVGGFLG